MKDFKITTNGNMDTQILISKSEFIERWVELEADPRGQKSVIIHTNSTFGGTPKHNFTRLTLDELQRLAQTTESWKPKR